MQMAFLLRTDASIAPLVLRLSLGVVMLAHGLQKVFGWFGGPGVSGTIESFTQKLELPLWTALLAMIIEVPGALALILGFFTRLAAFGTACSIGTCALLFHLDHGFFMNWFGRQKGEGVEYHILVIGISLALMIAGGGALSLDHFLERRQASMRHTSLHI